MKILDQGAVERFITLICSPYNPQIWAPRAYQGENLCYQGQVNCRVRTRSTRSWRSFETNRRKRNQCLYSWRITSSSRLSRVEEIQAFRCVSVLHEFSSSFLTYSLVGNYGSAWQMQKLEFATFPGPIVMTTNCIVEPRKYVLELNFLWCSEKLQRPNLHSKCCWLAWS